MMLGAMALTVIPDLPTSWAASSVSRETEAFETAYGIRSGRGRTPIIAEILMMRPYDWPPILRKASLVERKAALRLMFII